MMRIVCVTVSTSREGFPSFTPAYTNVVPGTSGNHGFVIRTLKLRQHPRG
jgi:hypothetical protein